MTDFLLWSVLIFSVLDLSHNQLEDPEILEVLSAIPKVVRDGFLHSRPLLSTLIHSHPLLSTDILFHPLIFYSHPLISTDVHSHLLISMLIHLYPLSSTDIHSYRLISTINHLYSLSSTYTSTLIHWYQLSCTLIHSRPLPSTHQLSSILIKSHAPWIINGYPLSSTFIPTHQSLFTTIQSIHFHFLGVWDPVHTILEEFENSMKLPRLTSRFHTFSYRHRVNATPKRRRISYRFQTLLVSCEPWCERGLSYFYALSYQHSAIAFDISRLCFTNAMKVTIENSSANSRLLNFYRLRSGPKFSLNNFSLSSMQLSTMTLNRFPRVLST